MPDPTAPATSSPLILVVDDQHTIREIARRILESQGYRVVTAVNGQSAIDIVRADQNEIALALLDMVMPQMDGLEAARNLRALRPNLQIILMSGDNAQHLATRHKADGIGGFVQKPFRLNTLLATVHDALKDRPPTSAL